jgi:hypothetical protein
MGGLVIKKVRGLLVIGQHEAYMCKACLQFYQENNANVDHSDLAERIKCLMFLATPHQYVNRVATSISMEVGMLTHYKYSGSDQANRLDRILRSDLNPLGLKTFVGELKSASLSNETINSDFKYIASNYLLYSFYENRPIPPLGLVVEKNNAAISMNILALVQASKYSTNNDSRWP